MMSSIIRFAGVVAAVLAGFAAPAVAAERIAFPFENAADARGFVNALTAFRTACLAQPVTRELPMELVPVGYQVVTRGVHWYGSEDGTFKDTAILSKTGREESDVAGGYPIVEFTLPGATMPAGACSLSWKRMWEKDYQDGVPQLRLEMAAMLAARVSFYLKAFLISAPDTAFSPADRYSNVSDWQTRCRGAKNCQFNLGVTLDDKSIDVTLTLRGVTADD